MSDLHELSSGEKCYYVESRISDGSPRMSPVHEGEAPFRPDGSVVHSAPDGSITAISEQWVRTYHKDIEYLLVLRYEVRKTIEKCRNCPRFSECAGSC